VRLNKKLISNPSIPLAGFSLPRQDWVTLNRLITGVCRCGQFMHRWHLKDNPACDCGESQQTIKHIIMDYQERKFQENMGELIDLTESVMVDDQIIVFILFL